MTYKPKSKEEMCQELADTYGWNYDELLEKNNENQILTLYTSCKDEDGTLRGSKK